MLKRIILTILVFTTLIGGTLGSSIKPIFKNNTQSNYDLVELYEIGDNDNGGVRG